MRLRSTIVLAFAVACACAAGPALASVAGQGASPRGSFYTGTSPQTVPQTTTSSTPTSPTPTTTTAAQTTTTPASAMVDVCLASARRAIAKSLGVKGTSVSLRPWPGNNGMPQCSYGVSHPHRGGPHDHVLVTVNVDNGPQATWRLMRKVVEATQIFGPGAPGWHAPIGLTGLGPYASWFINLRTLMAVNHTHTELLMATVSWQRARRAQMIALARAVTVAYIRAPAHGHPNGPSGY